MDSFFTNPVSNPSSKNHPLTVTFKHENDTQAWRNYYDLRKKFLDLNRWCVNAEHNVKIKFKVFNSLKRLVNRSVQVGDWISVSSSAIDSSHIFLNVKDIHNNHEFDRSEECIKIKFEEYKSMELDGPKVSGLTELVLKRKQSLIQFSLKNPAGNERNLSTTKNINWLPVMKSFLAESMIN